MLNRVSSTFWPVEGKLFSQKAWVGIKAERSGQIARINEALRKNDDELILLCQLPHQNHYESTNTVLANLERQTFRDIGTKNQAIARIYRQELEEGREIEWQNVVWQRAVIDTSVLQGGSGEAPVYSKDPYHVLLVKAMLSIFTTPFYLLGTIGYYLLRIVPISIIIFGAALAERIKWGSPDSRKYHFVDIPKEVGYSLGQIVISPYYALGYLSGLLISIVLPMSGWKIATSFERKWSGGDDVPKSKAYWIPPSVKGRDFKWLSIRRHHAHGPQCRHPVATAVYRGGNLDHIETLESKTPLIIKDPSECGAHWYLPAGCER